MNTLSVKRMALAMGILWAFCTLLTGVTAMYGWGGKFVEMMASIYLGYEATPMGAVIGMVWAFFDGLIGGGLLAFLYNKLSCCEK